MTVLALHVSENQKWTATALRPYSGVTLKSPISGNLPSEHTFKWCSCSSTLWVKGIYINSWSMVNGLAEWSGSRRKKIRKQVIRRGIPVGMVTKCEGLCSKGYHPPESIQHRWGITQQDGVTRSVDISQLLLSITHQSATDIDQLAQWVHKWSSHDDRVGSEACFSLTDLI